MKKIAFYIACLVVLVIQFSDLMFVSNLRDKALKTAADAQDLAESYRKNEEFYNQAFNKAAVETKKAQDLANITITLLEECRAQKLEMFQATNIWLPSTNIDTKLFSRNSESDAEMLLQDAKDYGALTNLVNLLIQSGEFCRVHDHTWVPNLKGYPAEQDEKPEWRECLICGLEEERARKNKPWHKSN